MKLIYSMPNMHNILIHISNLLENNYDYGDSHNISERAYIHSLIIIRLSKMSDRHILDDMYKVLLYDNSHIPYLQKNSVHLIETNKSYYISMSIQDMYRLCKYDDSNIFVYELNRVLKSSPIPEDPSDSILWGRCNKGRVQYRIEQHPKVSFHILNDMKYLVSDYFHILNKYNDISREDLNKLYRLSIWIKSPIRISRYLTDDFNMITQNEYRLYSGSISYNYDEIYDRKSTFKLSQLTPFANLNPENIIIDVNGKMIRDLMSIYDRAVRNNESISNSERSEYDNLLPVSTHNDLFLTISLEKLSLFLTNDEALVNKPYYGILNSISNSILHNLYAMEYILTGIRRT